MCRETRLLFISRSFVWRDINSIVGYHATKSSSSWVERVRLLSAFVSSYLTNGHFFYALVVVRERFISPTIRSFRNQPKTAMKGKKIEPQLTVGSMAFTDPAADRQTMIKSSAGFS